MLPLPVPRSRIFGCGCGCGCDCDCAWVLQGANGKDSEVRNLMTFSGALCSVNQDVPGSSSSSSSSSLS